MPKTAFTDDMSLSTDWVSEAPVRKLERAEFETLAKWLQAQLKDWAVTPPSAAYVESAKTWNGRLNDGFERAEVIELMGGVGIYDGYAYFYSGKPVAMMAIDSDETSRHSAVYIDSIVCHPGAKNGGDILIEYAANLSEQMGFGGKVKLASVEGAIGFYRSVGFVAKGDKGLVPCALDPAASELWEKRDRNWVLKAVWRVRGEDAVLESYDGLKLRN